MKRASTAGAGCAALFFFPFIGFGVAALVLAVRRFGEGKGTAALGLGALGLVFAGVGFGGLLALRAGTRMARQREELEVRHPDAPWLWRDDWAAGRVLDMNRSAAAGLWGFALLWNLIALPAAFFGIRETLAKDNPAGWLALLFPAVGVGLIVAACRASLRSRKFAASQLKDIVLKIGMQSGDRVWYDLHAVRANGRKLDVGGGIRDKREAEWIATQLRRALGLG